MAGPSEAARADIAPPPPIGQKTGRSETGFSIYLAPKGGAAVCAQPAS